MRGATSGGTGEFFSGRRAMIADDEPRGTIILAEAGAIAAGLVLSYQKASAAIDAEGSGRVIANMDPAIA